MATHCRCVRTDRRPTIGGVPLDPLELPDVIERLESYLSCGACHLVHHLSADPITQAQAEPRLRSALGEADLNLADGAPVAWFLRRLANSSVPRITGVSAMLAVLDWGRARGVSHAFVGADDQTLGKLSAKLRRDLPGVEISDLYAPPVREVSAQGVIEDLSRLRSGADMLWVGLGTPKQQIWARQAQDLSPARVIVTVGAALEFVAGTRPRAPMILQRIGMEWAFRLTQEPSRLWRRYLLGNPRFLSIALADLRRSRWRTTS